MHIASTISPRIIPIMDDLKRRSASEWYIARILDAVARGWYRAIGGRQDNDLYLLRCWLTPPRLLPDGDFESGDSALLHFFPRGDDDEALHDHPWDFTTSILMGGYWEHLPVGGFDHGLLTGPGWKDRILARLPGDTVYRRAEDLHCVGELLDTSCVTLVTTGPRRREWGFHPPGRAWIPYKDYITERAALVRP